MAACTFFVYKERNEFCTRSSFLVIWLKISRLHGLHGTEMAKLSDLPGLFSTSIKLIGYAFVNFPLVCYLYEAQVGKESPQPTLKEETGILLPSE